jgi:hypothetical protein
MSVNEQYARAINSKNLKVQEFFCDADKIIAAGWVVGNDERRALALSMQRWMSGDLRGMGQVVEVMAGWVKSRSLRSAEHTAKPIRPVEAVDIARSVCAWWMHRVCPECGGHGHPLMEGAPVLDESKLCPACNGTGQRSLTAGMTPQQAELASWLAGSLEAVAPFVFSDMARRLRADMDL